MPYRYETHLHTSQGSACGFSTGREIVQLYKEMGYRGIIVTDHFFRGNSAVPRDLPWREKIELFCAGYEDALAEGKRCGLDVFFGWEQRFKGDEFLVYGLDKQWLLEHPEMELWTRRDQLEQVRRAGGCVVQPHPFRDRDYIKQILLGLQFADAIEVANAGNQPYNDAYALRYAREYDLFVTAGSDNHWADDPKWREGQLMGIEVDEPLCSIHDYVRLIRQRGPVRPIIPEGRFEVERAEAPDLETFWLDDQERPVPTGRHWMKED